ncbi:hypothetical protein AB1Y20_022038 [Prymnesium parvum]|uniref:EF-hand domain-containing protein n=1 Tax=Prymnesium parvum TaxID=97485 RepID=A0AB34JH68_PRYPA
MAKSSSHFLSPEAVVREISSAFLAFDCGAKGYLTRHEFRAVHLSLLGHQPSLVELNALMPKHSDVEARMELPELCEVLARRMCAQDADEVIRRAFRAFDARQKGYISLADLQLVMHRVAPHLPQRTVDLIFSQVDEDKDGKVSFRDFYAMMSARPGGHTPTWPAPASGATEFIVR